jgi:gliding motility-associated-like protein
MQTANAEVSECDSTDIPEEPVDTVITGNPGSTEPDVFPFFIPTAFTPDGDGINDVFEVAGPQSQTYEFIIYNRWGQPVFRADELSDRWTGGLNAGGEHYVQDGIYTYLLTATMFDRSIVSQSGHLTIVR